MDKSILIIGAGGFIGGFIAKAALDRGYRTTVGVRESTSRRYLTDPRLSFAVLDYDDCDAMAEALKAAAPESGKWDYIIWNLGATKCANFGDFNRINYLYLRDFVLMLERPGSRLLSAVCVDSYMIYLHIKHGCPILIHVLLPPGFRTLHPFS